MSGLKRFAFAAQSQKLTTAEDIEPHLRDLKATDDYEEIVVSGNSLGIGACEALAKALKTQKKAQVVDCSNLFIGRGDNEIPTALNLILEALLTLPNLRTVDLAHNAIGPLGHAPLVSFLAAHTPLQHLILDNGGFGPGGGLLIGAALITLAEKKEAARKEGKEVPYLESVICTRSRLESGSMKTWARALALHTHIKTLKMSNNGIRQGGITYLMKHGLSNATHLEVLELDDSTFTTAGAVALSKNLPTWPSLRELNVNGAYLEARGAFILAKALAQGHNKSLQVLKLACNEIQTLGLTAIVRAAESSLPKLRRVELVENEFSAKHADVEKLRKLLEAHREATGEENSVERGLDLDDEDENAQNDDEDDSDEEEEFSDDEDNYEDLDEESDEVPEGDKTEGASKHEKDARFAISKWVDKEWYVNQTKIPALKKKLAEAKRLEARVFGEEMETEGGKVEEKPTETAPQKEDKAVDDLDELLGKLSVAGAK